MSREIGKLQEQIRDDVLRMGFALGLALREARTERHLSMRQLAELSGVSSSRIGDVESGRPASLEVYARLARALQLKPDFEIVDRRRPARLEDPVHAAMGETLAGCLKAHGFGIGLDEPFQHYQFSGRGDVVVWSLNELAFLHVEDRTRFVDLQDSFGSYNAKRAYLAAEVGERLGVRRWRSETHVMAALWSSEVIHQVRLHRVSFESIAPDPPSAFMGWLEGRPPAEGRSSTMVFLDPVPGARRDAIVGLAELDRIRPRYRDYADALDALHRSGATRGEGKRLITGGPQSSCR